MNDQDNKSLRIYEAIAHEAALDASDRGVELTPAENEEANRIARCSSMTSRTSSQSAPKQGDRRMN